MKTAIRFFLCWFVVTTCSFGVEPPDERTAKYFEILEKRPESRPLFDRFYVSWLDNGTVESLRVFLEHRVESSPAAGVFQIQAAVLQELGEVEEALEALREGRIQFPDDAEIAFQLARQQMRLQQNDEALETLRAAAAFESEGELAIKIAELEGQLLLRQGNSEAALEVWRKLLDANPDDDELRIDVIDLLAAEGLMEEAIKASAELIAKVKDPYDKAVRQARHAELLRQASRRDDALKLYEELLAASGAQTWLERETLAQIDAMFRSEDAVDGLKDFLTKLREAEPQRISVRRELANVLASLREGDAAVTEYRELLKITPGDRAVREGFVNMLAALQRYEDAVKEVTQLVELFPDDPELLVLLAKMQHWAEDNLGAGETMRKFIDSSEKEEHHYLRASRLLESFKLVSQAQQLLEESITAFPDSIGAREALADFLYRNAQEERALTYWQELAKNEDLGVVLRATRNVATRSHHKEAFDWLDSRLADFGTEGRFLEAYLNAAVSDKRFEEALPSVRPLVQLTDDPHDLEETSKLVVKLAIRGDAAPELLEELSKGSTPQEVCIHAALEHQFGEVDEAFARLERLIDAGDDLAAEFALNQIATMHQMDRSYKKAAAAMERLIARPGGKKTAHLQRVVRLHRSGGQLKDALRWLREWKPMSPGNPQIWLDEGDTLFAMTDEEEAFRVMRQAIGRFEDDDRFPSKLAAWYLEVGMAEDAEQLYWRLYDQSEDDGDRLTWARRLYTAAQHRGAQQDLIDRLQERAERNRGAVGPLLALAEVYRNENNAEKWRETLHRAVKLAPRNVELLMAISTSYQSEAKWEQALAALEQAMEHDTRDRAKKKIPEVLLLAGRTGEAMRKLEELILEGNANTADAEAMAVAMVPHVTFSEAAEFVDRMAAAQPDAYRLHYLAGVFREEAEDFEGAAESFIRVLNAPPEAQKQPQNPGTQYINVQHSYFSSYGYSPQVAMPMLDEGFVPKQTYQVAQWWMHRASAYNHRLMAPHGRLYNKNLTIPNQSGYSMGYSGYGGEMIMPISADVGRAYALEHLGRISAKADDALKEKIHDEFTAYGLPQIQVGMLEQAADPKFDSAKYIGDRLDDEVAAAVWVMLQLQSNFPNKHLKAAQLLADNFPELAFQAAAAGLVGENDLGADYRDLCVKVLPEIDASFSSLPTTLIHALSTQITKHPEDANDPFRIAMRATLVEALDKMAADNPDTFEGQFQQAFMALARDQDREGLAKIMKHAHTVGDALWAQRSGAGWVMFNPQANYFAPGLPSGVGQLFANPANNVVHINGQWASSPQGASKIDAEIWESFGDLTDFQVFKFLFTFLAGEGEVEDPESFLTDPEDSAAAVLVSTYLESKDDPKRAFEILLDASAAAEIGYASAHLDTSICRMLALEIIEISSLTDAQKEIVKGCAQRLTGTRLYGETKNQLVALMNELDMIVDAKRLARRAPAMPNAQQAIQQQQMRGSLGFIRVNLNQNVQQVLARVKELANAGDREGAGRLLAPTAAIASVRLFTQYGQAYETQQIREHLNRDTDLREVVLNELKPADDASDFEKAKYAAVCECVGKKEEAIAVYKEILKRAPKDDTLRLRLVIHHLQNDEFEELSREFRQLHSTSRMYLQTTLASQGDRSVKQWFMLCKLALEWLADEEKPTDEQLTWVQQIWAYLTNSQYDNESRFYLPELFGDPEEEKKRYEQLNPAQKELYDKAQEERIDYFVRISEELMESSTYEQDAFRTLYAWRVRQDEAFEPTDADFERVEQILTKPPTVLAANPYSINLHSPVALSSVPHYGMIRGGWYRRGYGQFYPAGQASLQTIHDVAGDMAFRGNRPDWIPEKIVPKMEKGPDGEPTHLAKQLEALNAAYFCKAEEFVEHVTEMMSSDAHVGSGQNLLKIDRIRELRELDSDLTEPLIVMHRKLSENSPYAASNDGNATAVVLKQYSGPDAYERTLQLLKRIAEIYLGPADDPEERERFFEAGSPDLQTGMNFAQLLSMAQNSNPQAMIWVWDYVREDLPQVMGNLQVQQYFNQPTSISIRNYEAEDVVSILRGHITGDWETFTVHPISMNQRSQHHSVLESIFAELKALDAEKKEPIQDAFNATPVEERTFGENLLLSWLKDGGKGMHQFLTESEDDLKQLDSRMMELAGIYGQLVTESDRDGENEPDWIAKALSQENTRGMEKFLAAQSVDDLGFDLYRIEENASNYLRLAMRAERDPKEVFAQVLKLWNAPTQNRGGRRSRTPQQLMHETWEQFARNDASTHEEMLTLTSAYLSLEDPPGVAMSSYEFKMPFQRWARAVNKLADEEKRVEAAKEGMEQLVKQVEKDPIGTALAAIGIIEFMDDFSSSSRGKLQQWARKERNNAKGARREVLEMVSIAENRNMIKGSWLINEHLGNDQIPLSARVALIEAFASELSDQAPDKFSQLGMEVIRQSWLERPPIMTTSYTERLVNTFAFSSERTDEWKEKARRVLAAWRALSAQFNPQRRPDSDVVRAMVAIQLGLDDSATALREVRRFDEHVSNWREVVGLFIQQGEFTIAEQLANQYWRDFNRSTGALRYNPQLHAQFEQFLETIEDEELRVIVETAFATMYVQSNTDVPSQEDRITEAAQKIGEHEFESATARDWALYQLAGYSYALEHLGEPLALWVESNPLSAFLSRDDMRSERANIWAARWGSLVAAGETESLLEDMSTIREMPATDSWSRRLSDSLSNAIWNQLQKLESEERLAAATSCLAIFREYTAHAAKNGNTNERLYTRNFVTHAFSDELEAYDEWWKELSDPIRAHIEKELEGEAQDYLYDIDHLFEDLDIKIGAPGILRIQARHEQLGFDEKFEERFFQELRYRGFPEEVMIDPEIGIGVKLAEAWPRRGYAWAELASFASRKNEDELTRVFYTKAIEGAEDIPDNVLNGWNAHLNKLVDAPKFLATKDASELGENDKDFEDIALKLILSALKKDDADLARKLYYHLLKMMEKRQAEGTPWPTRSANGWSESGELLKQIAYREEGGLAWVEMVARVYAENKDSKIAHPGYQTLFQTKDNIRDVFFEAGGQYSPQVGTRQLLTELHERVGDLHPAFLAMVFKEQHDGLKYRQRLPAMLWADSVAEDDPLYPLAREYAMAARIAFSWNEPEHTGVLEQIPEPEAFRDHYLKTVQDESLPLGYRVALCDFVISLAPHKMGDEFTRYAGELVIEGMEHGRGFTGWSLHDILRHYVKLEVDDRWKKSIERLNVAWLKMNENNEEEAGLGIAYKPIPQAILMVSKANLLAGNRDFVRSQMNEAYPEQQLYSWTATLINAAEVGWAEQVAFHLGAKEPDFNVTYFGHSWWTDEVARQLPIALEKVEDEGRRFYGEVTVSMLPDPPAESGIDVTTPRTQRLKALSERYPKIKFPSPTLRDRALIMLSGSPTPAVEPIHRHVAGAYLRTNIQKIASSPNGTDDVRRLIKPLCAHIRLQILKGNAAPAVRAVLQSNHYKKDRRAYVAAGWKEICNAVITVSHETVGRPNEELATEAAVYALGAIMATTRKELIDQTTFAKVAAAYIVANARAGTIESADQWYADLEEERRVLIAEQLRNQIPKVSDAFAVAVKRMGKGDAISVDLESRIAYVKAVQEIDLFTERFKFAPEWFRQLTRKGVFKPEEWNDYVAVLVKQYPRGGNAALEAGDLAARVGDFEAAEEWHTLSYWDEKYPRAARNRLRYIETYLIYEKEEMARETLAELEEVKDLPEDLRQEIVNARKALN